MRGFRSPMLGALLDVAAQALVDGQSVRLPDGRVAEPQGPAEDCWACDECRGIGKTRRFKVRP